MRCTERKIRLSGEEVSFDCELLTVEKDYGVLRYVIEKGRTVGGVRLPDGTITLALYFAHRPYNLYYWIGPKDKNATSRGERGADNGHGTPGSDPWARDIAYYFNIAEPVRLSREEVAYRDLEVDVIVLPDGQTRVLDEEQLPASLDPALRRRITMIRDDLLTNYEGIIREARALLLPYARTT